jgi:hypothetical protein
MIVSLVKQLLAMQQDPWWQAGEAKLGWDEPLPEVIKLAPDYGAEFRLWGDGFGIIAWQYTKFPPGLLDRLAAWQREFDACYPLGPGLGAG